MNATFVPWVFGMVALSVALAQPLPCNGQSSRPPSVGGVLVPVATGLLGTQDPAALAEITAHRAVVGAARWDGMQGTGTIIFGALDTASYPATLSNLGGNMFRLDVQEQTGSTSTRIHGPLGKVQGADGTATAMPPSKALVGIYPFERLRRASFSSPGISLTDHGMVVLGGAQLHRITLEYGSVGRTSATRSRATIATDLYFDPSTHLLAKTATMEMAPSGRQANFLVVVTYEDYRNVGNTLVPFRYTETMDGQTYSTLQLTSVELKPALNPSYFEF